MSEERFQIEQIEPKEELNLDFVNQHVVRIYSLDLVWLTMSSL